MKKKLRRVILILAVLVGFGVLTSGLFWNSLLLPRLITFAPSGTGGNDFSSVADDEEVLMEGRMGFMSLIWDSIDGRGIDGKYPTQDDFTMIFRDVYITPEGVFDKATNRRVTDQPNQDLGEGETFPSGGVGKRSYSIYNSALNESITVEYSGETSVFGRTGYIYSSNIIDQSLVIDTDTFSDTDLDGEISDMITGMEGLYSDTSRYILDPRTSIPYDIQLDITSSVIFPDSTLLTVLEEQVRYSEEVIWIPSSSGINRIEEKNVIVETRISGKTDPDDELIGLYTQEITYFDSDTGEPLPSELQGGSESFAVDRSSYQYILGYKGTRRTGFYQFPVGNVMKRDYPMWDESLEGENVASFTGESSIDGIPVYIYTMVTEGVEVEGGNAFLPIYLHPGTTYELDTVQKWFIDAETGFMLDFVIEGNIIVSGSGPLDLVEQSVGSFIVDLPENTTKELMEVSDLFRDLLIPLSGKRINVFSLEISFSEELQRTLVEVADQVSFIMNLLENRIPVALKLSGAVILLVLIASATMYKARARRKKDQGNVYIAILE